MSDGDLDKEESFTVLAKTNMPAALIEYMFIVNPSDAQILKTKQAEFAERTAKGILNYLGIKYVSESNKIRLDILGKKVEVKGFNNDNTNYITIDGRDVPIKTVLEALGLKVESRGNEVVTQ